MSVADTFYIKGSTTAGCYQIKPVIITFIPAPNISVSYISPLCAGSNINLLASGGTSYSWSGPNGFTSANQNPVLTNTTVNTSGFYTVNVLGNNGCFKKDSVNLLVNASPVAKLSLQ